jgi:hypothetical protein
MNRTFYLESWKPGERPPKVQISFHMTGGKHTWISDDLIVGLTEQLPAVQPIDLRLRYWFEERDG